MNMRVSVLALVSAAGLMTWAGNAGAATLSATQLIQTYNAIVFTNLVSSSEMDGNALVGGNVQGGGFAEHGNLPSTPFALTVGGNVSSNPTTGTGITVNGSGVAVGGNFTAGNVNLNGGGNLVIGGNVGSSFNANFNGKGNLYVVGSVLSGSNIAANGGNAYIGGTVKNGANVNANGGGRVFQNSSVPATQLPNIAGEVGTAKTELTAYSQHLAGFHGNSTITESNGTTSFVADPNASGVAVFDITSATVGELSSASQFSFTLNGAKEVIINVSGVGSNPLDISANFLNGVASQLATDTVWNFTDATNIDIKSQFGGTILADLADVTTSGNIEGTVIADALNQNAEIHYDGQQSLVSAAPLPAALPMFGAAIAGLGGLRLRLRKARKLA